MSVQKREGKKGQKEETEITPVAFMEVDYIKTGP